MQDKNPAGLAESTEGGQMERVGVSTRFRSAAQWVRFDYRNYLAIIVVVVVWQVVASMELVAAGLFPGPVAVAQAWWKWIVGPPAGPFDGTWLMGVGVTAVRVFIGYAIAAAAGVSVGIFIGYFRTLFAVLDPLIQLFRPIPSVAWVPLAIVFFGFSPFASLFLIAYGSFFPIVVNTTDGVLRSQAQYIQVGAMLGATRPQMLWNVVLPAALPSVFTGLRLGVGIAWILAIVAELIAARSGLGYSLQSAYTVFRYDIVIAGMISFGLMGFISDRLVLLASRRVLAWREGYEVGAG
jgi:ABC-type nitrate/sulfonate/bicarbonate transport system permease component